jgi:hypothetical protein
MTLPPNRFGAHYCGGALVPEMAHPSEASTELFSHRIVGIIMKTLVLPKPIHCGRDVALMSAEAAESREVLILDLKSANFAGRTSRLNWAFLRERGTVRTSTRKRTPADCNNPTNSSMNVWNDQWKKTRSACASLIGDTLPRYAQLRGQL